jgi:DNA-binding MarR family transcriptional regulator
VTTELSPDLPAPTEPGDPLGGSLCHELRKTSVAVMAAMTGEFGQWGLKPSEANLLAFVGANPGCTQSDIARAHRSNPANLVPLVARLERDGLIERIAGDGRAIALSVSAKGRGVLAHVDAGFARLEDRLGAELSGDQRDAVIDALRIICKAACHYDKG